MYKFYLSGLNQVLTLIAVIIIITMLRLITTFTTYLTHFSRQLQTAPLYKVNRTLQTFISERVSAQKYQQSFSSYQSFIQQTLNDNPDPDPQKIILLDHITHIYEIYKLPSKKLLKIQNRLALECFDWAKSKSISEIIRVLVLMQRYNKKKALALFLQQKQLIMKQIRTLNNQTIISLLKFLKDSGIEDTLIRETAIQMIYQSINSLNQVQIHSIMDCLAWSKKYINKQFLIKLGNRFLVLYKSNNISDKHIYNILAYLSEIQVNLHSRSVYVQEFDEIYSLILPTLMSNLPYLYDTQINRLTSAIRRSKHYDQSLIQQLIQASMKRQIQQFSGQTNPKSIITLRTFVNIINSVAVFNYNSPQFKKYVLSILKLLMTKTQIVIPPHLFSKLLWSICVLFERHEVSQIYPLIQSYIKRSSQIPIHEGMTFYYCYLYLRTSYPKINEHRQNIYKMLEGFKLQTKASQIQQQVFKTMLSLGIPCLSEYNINNLICDLMVPEWKNVKNTIIEVHGFRHFFRNVKKLTGSSALKTKILKGEMFKYYFISADEWMIAEDKLDFLSKFMEHINQLEGAKSQTKEIPVESVRTSTRIRGRPKVFKLADKDLLPNS